MSKRLEESVRNKQQMKPLRAVDLIYMNITPVENTALNNVHICEDTSSFTDLVKCPFALSCLI